MSCDITMVGVTGAVARSSRILAGPVRTDWYGTGERLPTQY